MYVYVQCIHCNHCTFADDRINSSTAVLSITPPALARSAAVSLIPLQWISNVPTRLSNTSFLLGVSIGRRD